MRCELWNYSDISFRILYLVFFFFFLPLLPTLMGFVQLPVPVPVRFGLVFAFSPLRIFYCAKNDFLFSIFWFDFGKRERERGASLERVRNESKSKSFHSRPSRMGNQFDFEYVMRRKKRVWKNAESRKKCEPAKQRTSIPLPPSLHHIERHINCLQGFSSANFLIVCQPH